MKSSAPTMKVILDKQIHDNIYWRAGKARASCADVDWGIVVIEEGDEEGNLRSYNDNFAKCKDYLNDTLATMLCGTKDLFSTGNARPNTSFPKDHFYITLRSTRVLDIEEGIKKFINPMEEAAGLEPTVVYKTDHPLYILLQADSLIGRDGFMLSTWYMLIRSMFSSAEYGELGSIEEFVLAHAKAGEKDSGYLRTILNYVKPEYFQRLFSIADDFVMEEERYKAAILHADYHVHEQMGGMELILALGNPTNRRGISTGTLKLLGSRLKMLRNIMPWQEGKHWVPLIPETPPEVPPLWGTTAHGVVNTTNNMNVATQPGEWMMVDGRGDRVQAQVAVPADEEQILRVRNRANEIRVHHTNGLRDRLLGAARPRTQQELRRDQIRRARERARNAMNRGIF